MLHAKNLFVFALAVSFWGCRPPYGSRVYDTATEAPLSGLAAATEVEEIKVGTEVGYKSVCLNGDTETHTKAEIETNKLCLPKAAAAAAAPQNNPAPVENSLPPNAASIVFGEKSFLKKNAVDCTANGCPTQQDACRVALSGTENVAVKSLRSSDVRAYDHIIAERDTTPQCGIAKVYVFFEHLTITTKFKETFTLPDGCVIAKSAPLEGRILKTSTPFEIKFRVKKGIACKSGGTFAAENNLIFSSDLIEITPVIRAILGL